jgi:thiol-disulfide isomerase/thioredoxin
MRALAMGIAILLTALNTFAGDLHWQTNWDEAFRIAKRERKMVFVDFYADWCKPCRWMETSVFPMEKVQERLRDYVLLRIDYDRTSSGIKAKVRSGLPAYIVYDYDRRDCFHFFGGMPAEMFLSRLDLAKEGMPFMLRAADLFAEKKDAEAWTQVAQGYTNVNAVEKSRDAWKYAERAAASNGDLNAAQVAAINGAFTWVAEGKATMAIELLRKITEKAVNKENEGLAWLMLGHAYAAAKDTSHARESYEKAKSLVTPDHAIARQADGAIARLH